MCVTLKTFLGMFSLTLYIYSLCRSFLLGLRQLLPAGGAPRGSGGRREGRQQRVGLIEHRLSLPVLRPGHHGVMTDEKIKDERSWMLKALSFTGTSSPWDSGPSDGCAPPATQMTSAGPTPSPIESSEESLQVPKLAAF